MKFILAAVMFLVVPLAASASSTITTVPDQTVFVGDTVSIKVIVTRTGGHANPIVDAFTFNNDWNSVEVNGSCSNTPNFTLGTGVSSTTRSFTATSTPGTYTIPVKVYRFDGCDDNFGGPGQPSEDDTTFQLTVDNFPTVTPPSPVAEERRSGHGGFICRGTRVLETEASGKQYWACRTSTPAPVVSGTLQSACFYANPIADNKANYCVGTNIQFLFDTNSAFRNALLWLYNNNK